jgi:hypothetical protein
MDDPTIATSQDAEKVRQRRSRIAQRLKAETTFLGDRKHVRGFSVCQELWRKANGSTKCGPYLLASSLAAALFAERRVSARRGWAGENRGFFEHPERLRHQPHLRYFIGVFRVNRVFPQPAHGLPIN